MPTDHHGTGPHRVLQTRLAQLEGRGLRRQPLCADRRQSDLRDPTGNRYVDFSSNDYLGLSRHRDCREAAASAAQEWGCGATASKLVTGDSPLHHRLEREMERWVDLPQAVLFPSGYQANLGALSALAGPDWVIYSDAQNHASIVDGCRLSRAHLEVYPHRDTSALEDLLRRQPSHRPALIVTDALFSMNGNLAPLRRLEALAQQHGALLMVDEAHGLGVLGPEGRGLCARQRVVPDVWIGTFSKGLGSHGAVAMAGPLIGETLIQCCRSLIYSTALPPPTLGASLASVRLARGAEGTERRARVLGLAHRLRSRFEEAGLEATGHDTPLVGVPFEGERTATRIHEGLKAEGLLVWAFRPPTVPPGTSLLRVSLRADHRRAEVDRLAERLLHHRETQTGLPRTAFGTTP